jgi:hypothetical protein
MVPPHRVITVDWHRTHLPGALHPETFRGPTFRVCTICTYKGKDPQRRCQPLGVGKGAGRSGEGNVNRIDMMSHRIEMIYALFVKRPFRNSQRPIYEAGSILKRQPSTEMCHSPPSALPSPPPPGSSMIRLRPGGTICLPLPFSFVPSDR